MNFDFLKSSNFWTNLVYVLGGLFIGFRTDVGVDMVLNFFGLLAGTRMFREYFNQKPKLDAGQAVNNSNWWGHLSVLVTAVVPNLPVGIIESLQSTLSALIAGNWQGFFVALFGLATIVYNLVISKRKIPTAA